VSVSSEVRSNVEHATELARRLGLNVEADELDIAFAVYVREVRRYEAALAASDVEAIGSPLGARVSRTKAAVQIIDVKHRFEETYDEVVAIINAAADRALEREVEPDGASASRDEIVLPGGLRWSNIEAKYRELTAQTPGYRAGHQFRRRKPSEPSRPELAHALNTSVATLKRACVRAQRGSRWPPAQLDHPDPLERPR
jgi:hypothetical protein